MLNRFSRRITQQPSQGASQAMLLATGLKPEDLDKPQVGVASVWYDGNPCNMHLGELGSLVKKGLQDQEMLGLRFHTIGVSDGISMGTEGMSYSLQSRDIIADSIETVMSAQWYDGLVAIPGCDKNMPGCLMAMARLNRPAIMVYGGTIAPGCVGKKDKLDVVSAFQSYGEYLSGKITDKERRQIIAHSCPGAGACGGMYTANTMAVAIETLGMSLPYSSSYPALSEEKRQECLVQIPPAMHQLLKLDLKPLDIMTRESFLNAIRVTMVLGGSTNAVLHLVAMARAADVDLGIEDFARISNETPFLADLKPSGKYVMTDLHEIGGTPSVLKMMLENGLINGDVMTVTGKTLRENLEACPGLSAGQTIISSPKDPLKKTGHLRILKGNLAPEGAVAKITGKEGQSFSGVARVFDCEEDMLSALEKGQIQKGDVIIIRYEGPKGGPGMPEMLTPTSAIVGANLHKDVAMITDGRFSGGSHGFIVGHVTPEAQLGGPIALVADGDQITIDAEASEIRWHVSPEEAEKRRQAFKAPPYKANRGTLYKYIKNVSSASEGCVTDE